MPNIDPLSTSSFDSAFSVTVAVLAKFLKKKIEDIEVNIVFAPGGHGIANEGLFWEHICKPVITRLKPLTGKEIEITAQERRDFYGKTVTVFITALTKKLNNIPNPALHPSTRKWYIARRTSRLNRLVQAR